MIIDQLVFGTARLTGGASARASRRLLHRCLAAGVGHIDTAPSYGLGTAEGLVGAALADRPDIRITAKAGSPHPRHPVLQSWARAAKALVAGRPSPLREDFVPTRAAARGAGFTFDCHALDLSLERSRDALRRDRLDVVLLHEVRPDALDGELLAWLAGLLNRGTAGSAGVSSGGMVDPPVLGTLPDDLVSQAAVMPRALIGGDGGQPMFVHAIANTVLQRERTDPSFAAWLEQARGMIPAPVADRRTASIVAGYARLHALNPDRRLIFASIDAARLDAFLAGVAHVDLQLGAAAFAPGTA